MQKSCTTRRANSRLERWRRLAASLLTLVWVAGCSIVPGSDDDSSSGSPASAVTGTATTGTATLAAGAVTSTGTTGAGGGTTTSTGVQCQPGFQLCDGLCVDTQSATEHCGTCGAACDEGRVCAAGACSTECVEPYSECNGVCVQLATDSANCGTCGEVCDLGSPCVGGVCGCPDGTLLCRGQCVDALSDAAHCGSCDAACPAGGACLEGSCECPAGTQLCGDRCVSLTSAEHCGTCDNACGVGQICAAGQCQADSEPCPGTTTRCGSSCVDTQAEPGHCGACDMACEAGQACQGGACGCGGLAQCGASCVDTNRNPLHCGGCNSTCTNGQTCQAGNCVCTDAEATLCGNRCVRLADDARNCGGCGNACTGGLPCTDGECRCPEGSQLCGTECVDTESEPLHCGECNAACPEGETCIVGSCSGAVGDACSARLAHGISVSQLAVYQAGKIAIMQDGNAIGVDERDVPVVAGKDAVFRVFIELEDGFANRILSARLSLLDGDNVEQLFHKRTVEGASSEGSLATTFNIEVSGDLIKPTTRYALDIVECGDASGTVFSPRFPESGEQELLARDVGGLRIHFVPLVANGIEASTDPALLDGYQEYMELMYPVSHVDYTVGEPLALSNAVSANGNGWEAAAYELQVLHFYDDAPNDVYYYGLMQPTETFGQYCQGGCVAGIGYVVDARPSSRHGRVSTGVSYPTQASLTSIAHEIGHNHGREHAPCGGVASPDNNFPHMGARIGWWGFVFPDQLVAGEQATDIMGYCENQWISDYTYNAFLERIATINGALSFVDPNPRGRFRVLLTSVFGVSWVSSPPGERTALGDPEPAVVLDADGNELAQVTVYRAQMGHLGAASIMVPEPEPTWHAIALSSGEPPIAFGATNASVP